MTRNAPLAPSTLNDLRAAFRRDLERLIAMYPIQEGNRAHYEAELEGAVLGTLTRRVRTKGGLCDLPKGSPVLVLHMGPEAYDPNILGATFYAPSTSVVLHHVGIRADGVKLEG